MSVTFTQEFVMSLAPLLAAPGVVQVHTFAALAALGLGLVQLAGLTGVPRTASLAGAGWH